jgi:hypothetical protein
MEGSPIAAAIVVKSIASILTRHGRQRRWIAKSLTAMRQQQVPIIGEGQGVYSFVHIDDAAGATAAALECPPGAYKHRRRKPVASALVADGVRACCRSTCATSRQRRRGASRPRRGLLRDEA